MFKKLVSKSSKPSVVPPPPADVVVAQETPPASISSKESFNIDEDDATARDQFYRVVPGLPSKVFSEFGTFVWRQNAGVGLNPESWVEIIKDSSTGQLEVGMSRRVAGYQEEIVKIVKDQLIEYRVINDEAESHVNALKGRITFREDEPGSSTMVRWTLFWSPSAFVVQVVYKILIQGYVNLALYQLDRKLQGLPDEQPREADSVAPPVPEQPDSGKRLQYAARLQTGYEGNLTAQQEQGLRELEHFLQTSDPETWALVLKHPDTPTRLMLRFLRAECHGRHRDFNVKKSARRLADTLRFRQDIGADALLTTSPPFFDLFSKLSADYESEDLEGRIVVWNRAGYIAMYMDIKSLADDEWIKGMVTVTERRFARLRATSARVGHEVSATVVVYDLAGLGIRAAKILKFAQLINSVAAVHYPESVDNIILLNAPAIFSSLWAMVQSWLDEVTRSKVRIYSASKRDKAKAETYLKTFCAPESIPWEYGGTCEVVVPLPLHAEKAGVKLPMRE